MFDGKLTDELCKGARNAGLLCDGNRLYLCVSEGSKSWIWRWQYRGRRHDYGLGGYSTVPLAAARDFARQLNDARQKGRDPVSEVERALRRIREGARQIERLSFKEVHDRYLRYLRDIKIRYPIRTDTKKYLQLFVMKIGSVPFGDIKEEMIDEVLRDVEYIKRQRMRLRLSEMISHARHMGCIMPGFWRGYGWNPLHRSDELRKAQSRRREVKRSMEQVRQLRLALAEREGFDLMGNKIIDSKHLDKTES